MKTRILAGFLLATFVISTNAATLYYWDINGNTAGAGPSTTPSSTWGSASVVWSTNAAGTSAAGVFVNGNTAVFSAGTNATGAFNVSVTASPTVDGIIVEEGNPRLNGATAIVLTGAGAFNVAFNSSLSITNPLSGSVGFTKNGSGLLNLRGTNIFTGGVTLNSGTVSIVNSNAFGTGTASFTLNGGTLRYDNSGTGVLLSSARPIVLGTTGGTIQISNSSAKVSYDGTISGIGNLNLAGGTMILSGANTYSGSTTIGSGGRLKVVNSTGSATGTGSVVVNSGSSLTGNGIISGNVSLSGAIEPGASPGKISTGSQTWNGGGIYSWEINDATGSEGLDPGWDVIDINGSLSIAATTTNKFTISINSLTAGNVAGSTTNFDKTQDYSWKIVKTTTGITGFGAGLININVSGFSNQLAANGKFFVEPSVDGKDLFLKYIHKPLITSAPTAQTKTAGSVATFSASAVGSPTLTYQWQKDGVDLVDAGYISGSQSTLLTISGLTVGDAGDYTFIANNPYGSATSAPPATLTVMTAPVITNEPVSQIRNQGDTAIFAVGVSGIGLSYVWKKDGLTLSDGGNILGSGTAVLTVTNVVSTNAGTYVVTVSNAAGSDTSSGATLDVIVPPTILTQLANQFIPEGDSTSFTISVSGTGPFSYQWRKDGIALTNSPSISGITNATLMIENAKLSDSGNYSVLVYNSAGTALSSNANLTVYYPSCTAAPSGLVAWWPGDYNTGEQVNALNGLATSFVSFAPAKVFNGFSFDGMSNYVQVLDSSHLRPAKVSVEAWVQSSSPGSLAYILSKSLNGGQGSYAFYSTSGGLEFYISSVNGGYYTSPNAGSGIWDGKFHHIVGTYDGNYVRLFVDGSEVGSGTSATGDIKYDNTYQNGDLFIGSFFSSPGGYHFNGIIDEVSIYNKALVPADVQNLYAARGTGKCQVPNVGSTPSTIYYSRTGSPDGTIWRAHGDGSSDVMITTGEWPKLSPDGKYLLFHRGNSLYTRANIWVRDMGTGIETEVFSNNDYVVNFGWSPDSSEIVFDYSCGIYRMNRDGSNVRNLVNSDCYDDAPDVRASDGKIVFHNVTGANGLMLCNGDGSSRSVIPNTTTSDVWPVWSPDGLWIAFVNGTNLFKIKPDGSSRMQLSYLSFPNGLRNMPAWSADGTKLFVAGTVNGVDGVFAVGASGTSQMNHILTSAGPSVDTLGSIGGFSTCTPPPSGLINWFRAEYNANDSVLSNIGYVQNGAGYAPGKVGQAFSFDGVDDNVDAPTISFPNGPVTLEAWVNFTGGTYARGSYNTIAEFGNDSPWFGVDYDGTLDLFGVIRGGAMPTNGWAHVAYTWDGNSSSLYLNGNRVATNNSAPPSGGYGLGIGQNNGDTAWKGLIDEVSIYNRALGPVEIQNVYNADLEGKCMIPSGFPIITAQPQNASIPEGFPAFFTVGANGNQPMTYQWRKNGVNLSDDAHLTGSQSNFLSFTAVQTNDIGFYSVIVSNRYGFVGSLEARLDVLVAPVIDVQPQSTTNPPGSTVVLGVAAHGSQPLFYTWKLNGVPVGFLDVNNFSGVNSSVLTISGISSNLAGTYTVDVSNSRGVVTSSSATVTVFSIGGENYDDLISYWHADGDATDSFGSNHGTLLGTTSFSTAGKINQGFHFDGTNGAAMIPDSPSLKPENITVEAWVKFDGMNSSFGGGASAGTQYIVFKKNSRSNQFEGYALLKARGEVGDYLSFAVASAGGTQAVCSSSTTVVPGVFYHVVGTYDGSEISLYVNGVLEDSQSAEFSLNYDTTPLYFGTSGETWDGRLNGVLDEVRLYGRAVTGQEVRAHFTQGNLGFVGLKLASTNFVDRTSGDRALGLSIAGGFAYVSGSVGASGGDAMISRFGLPTQSTNVPLWLTNWPNLSGSDRFSSVAVGFDGVYFGGDSFNRSVDSFGSKENKGMVVKFPFNGPVGTNFGGSVWDKQVPASPGAFSYSGKETINGMVSTTEIINDSVKAVIYVTGSSQRSSSNPGRLFLSKMRGDGTILWTSTDVQATAANSDSMTSGQGIVLLNGDVFVAGRSDEGGSPKAMITKFSSSGAIVWSAGTSSGVFNAITAFGGSLYAVGSTTTNGSSADFLLEKRDDSGRLLWSRTYDRGGQEDILNGVVGIGSRVYAVGSTKGNTAGGKDAVILEIDTATGDLVSATLYGGSDDDAANAAATDGSDLYVAGESKSYGGSGNNVMLLRYQVSQPAVQLGIITSSLPVGVVSNAYSIKLQAVGGLPPYNWSIAESSGSLPEGLYLTSDGTLSGTPTTTENTYIDVQVTDSGSPANTVTESLNLVILDALTPPSVSISSPTNGSIYDAPANLSVFVSATDADGLSQLLLYRDGIQVGSSRDLSSSANVTFEVSELPYGSYNFYAVAYDYYQTPATSSVIHVTVNATGLRAIDFEAFNISSGAVAVTEPAISGYLNSFGISVSDVTAGSYLIVNRDQNFGNGNIVTASSGHNLFTQTGKNGAVSYTLNFASPAASFRFTRVKLLGSAAGVTHPFWRATAYNGTTILGSVGEGSTTAYNSIPEQSFVLYGPNITSVKVEADNYNYASFTSALLDDFVVVTNAAVINNQPPTITLSSPSNGASYTSPAQVTIAASASDSDGTVENIKLYLGRTLLTTIPGSSGSFTLNNLAPNTAGYQVRAEATDNGGAVKSSDTVTFYVVGATGVNVINFDAVDATSKNIGTTNLAAYLATYGVTVTNITTGSRLEIANVKNIAGGSVIVAGSPENVLAQSSRGGSVSYTLNISTPVESIRFTRPQLLAGSYGVTFPQWRARAFNSSGTELMSVGESLFYSSTNVSAQVFELAASGISTIRFDSDGQSRSTVSGLVIDDLILNTNAGTRPMTVTITSPVNNASYSAPADITIAATASGNNPIDHVEFYAGPLLISSDSSASYEANWNNVYPGSYELRAMAVDTQGNRMMSDPVHVNVTGGTTVNNLTFVNFDSLNTSTGAVSGADLETYLGGFGISLDYDDATAVVKNQQSFMNAARSGIIASSQPNAFTQVGAADHMSFELSFTQPLTQFQFTRVKLIAGVNGVTHPSWQAYAYDSAGNVASIASEGFTSSYSDVASQTYTLSGQGIVRVRFDSINRGAANFNAVVIDDLVLTRPSGNIPPAISIVSPVSRESFYAPANIDLKAVASDPDGDVTQVAFYANGSLIGTVTNEPYELRGTNVGLGSYTLTAVATDNSGATNMSSPVTISVIPSPFTFAIWRQPQSISVARGGTAFFRVVATGTNLITYQWQFGGTNLVGQTNASLTLNNVDTAQVGTYRVLVNSEGTTLTSSNATLTIGDSPSISVQPEGQTVNAGDNVTFTVTASGATPLFYQWTLNGNPIPGATGPTYTITGAQPFNSGFYQVIVANSLGYVQSDKANLSVLIGSATAYSADNFADRISINPLLGAVFGNNQQATRETGEGDHVGKRGGKSIWFTWHASFSGMISLSTKGSSFDTLLAVYTGDSITNLTLVAADDDGAGYFASQVTFNAVEGTDYQIVVDGFKGASGTVVLGLPSGEGYRVLDYAAGEQVPRIVTQPVSEFIDAGGTATLEVEAEGPAPLTYQWYLNGNVVSGATNSSLVINSFSEDSVGRYYVVVANDAGSVQSITVTLEMASTTEGQTTTTTEDKVGDITVIEPEDGGEGEEGRGSNGPGSRAGTSRGFTTTQVFSTVGATKEADEPNHCGVVGGASVWYGYLAPASGTISIDTIGSTFDTILAVYTTPSGFLDFATLQSKGCTNVDGNGGEVVQFAAISNKVYYIAVDGVAGATGTVHLNINLGTPPSITSAPQNTTVAFAGNNATLSVSATGSTNLYYRWKFNNANMAGQTNSTLSVTNVQNGINTGLYSVVVSNLITAVTSTPAILDIAVPPSITSQPSNTNGVYGKSVTLSVGAAGSATLRYQWQFNNVNIAGATSSSYTKSALRLTNAGDFRVIITNVAGAVTSSVATLSIVPAPPNIKLPLATARYTNVGSVANFSGNFTNGMGVTGVQYQVNGGPFQNANVVSTNWSASVTLNIAGTNVIGIKALSASGDSTVTNRNVYVYQLSPVTVVINSPGSGTIAPATTGVVNGQNLEIGKNYTITAVPASLSGQAYIFTNWSGDVSGTAAKLTFQMQSNLTIQANFIANPFVAAKGTYGGLFTNSTYDYKASGYATITLQANQSASGSLTIDGDKCSFSGKFSLDGQLVATASRNNFGKPPLTVSLAAIFGSDQITGTVSDGTFTSTLLTEHAFYSKTNPQTNYAGKYTMILPHADGSSTNAGGYGYALLTVSTNGSIVVAGTLGDNVAVAQPDAFVSKNGRWPLFSGLYSQKYVTNKYSAPFAAITNTGFRGSLMGWLQFSNNAAISGDLKWVKTTITNRVPHNYTPPFSTNYPVGFTNELEVTALRFVPVLSTRPVLPGLTYPAASVKVFTNAVITFSDGNLSSPFTNNLFIHSNNIVTLPSTNSAWTGIKAPFTESLAIASGLVSGNFYHPGLRKMVAYKGAVLQEQNRAYGLFQGYVTNGVGTNQTGAFSITIP